MEHLTFGVGDWECAMPLEHVIETMRPLPLSPVEDAPDFILGLSIVRGEPVPIVDLGRLLRAIPVRPTRLVTVRALDHVVGLAVSRVHGFVSLPAATTLPPLLSPELDLASSLAARDEQLLFVLSASRITERAGTEHRS